MRFDKRLKVHEVASKERGRYRMDLIRIERHDSGARLVATDGRMLAVVPVDLDDSDDSGTEYVTPLAVKEATKKRVGPSTEAEICLNGGIRVSTPDGVLALPPADEVDPKDFPDWSMVVPGGEVTCRVAFNPAMLAKLAAAIGSTAGVVLEIVDGKSPIVVRPAYSLDESHITSEERSARFGLVMPIPLEAAMPESAKARAAREEREKEIAARRAETSKRRIGADVPPPGEGKDVSNLTPGQKAARTRRLRAEQAEAERRAAEKHGGPVAEEPEEPEAQEVAEPEPEPSPSSTPAPADPKLSLTQSAMLADIRIAGSDGLPEPTPTGPRAGTIRSAWKRTVAALARRGLVTAFAASDGVLRAYPTLPPHGSPS